jgi:peptide/nickel transport system substrate-binding protein
MHRRIVLMIAGAVAVLGLAGSAGAMTFTRAGTSRATLGTTSFAEAWAGIPRTPAARAAKKDMVFGLEQTVTGFNILDLNEEAFYAAIVAGTPVIRGAYVLDQKAHYHLDLASKVKANQKFLKIWIRKDANWNWLGHKPIPVTAADFIYTWKQEVAPSNNVGSSTGYTNIARAKVSGHGKVVTFFWKKGQAFADYRDIFTEVLPGFALKGQSYNDYWHTCVCGNDGHPISNGPFYMASYTPGQGMVLKKNPTWYGKKAGLNTIAFKIITDTNSEIQAMRGGEVDAIAPSPESGLTQLIGQKSIKYSAIPSISQEHWDMEVANPDNPLMKKLYIRAAMSEGMNRQSLINALYGKVAPGLKPLNNPEFELGPNASGKFAYFKKYNYSPKKAIALLKKNGCTGGPSAPSANNHAVWTCGGQKTVFNFDTTTRASRQQSGAIFTAQLMAIGIKLNPTYHDASSFFGTFLPAAHFDIGEYGWTFGSADPSNWDSIYQCFNAPKNLGGSNYKRFCNAKVDKLIKKGDSNFGSPASRIAQYQQVAKILADQVAVIPLYAPPTIFVYKKALKGAANSNNPTDLGPTWNIENWHW